MFFHAGGMERGDALIVLGLSVLTPVIRWILEVALYKPFALWVLAPAAQDVKGRAEEERLSRVQAAQRTASKMTESLWKLTAYASMLGLELAIIRSDPWFLRPRDYWVGWPNQPELPLMQVLFFCQLAYYASTTFMLALWEVPRSDFWVMQTHHLATLVLVYLNYCSGYQRWGCLIMALHDTTDVLMEAAKNFRYAGRHAASTACFAAFMAAWVALRLGLFPWVLVRSTLLDSVAVLGYTPPHHGVLNALLCLLCCFHVYWFVLIVKVAVRTVREGSPDDVREKDD